MSIGRRLAAARLERGLEVEDVSRATRIRVPIVQAIEADDLASAGPAAYARGHLRSIAGLLGVDPAPLIAEYDRKHAPSTEATSETWGLRDPAVARADSRSQSWLGAAVVTMLVVVALVTVGLVVEQPTDQVVATAPPPPAQEQVDPFPAPSPGTPAEEGAEAVPDEEEPDPASTGPAGGSGPSGRSGGSGSSTSSGRSPAADRVTVRVAVPKGRSWLEVSEPSGRTLFAGVLESGTSEEFTASRELRMTVGDASAVRLEVDGERVPVAGGKGEVAKLRVRRGGAVTPG